MKYLQILIELFIAVLLVSDVKCQSENLAVYNNEHNQLDSLNSYFFANNFFKTRSPTPIEASCLSYYSYLAKLGSLFTQCVVSYSRPFRVCENCLKYYLEILDAKKLIKNVPKNFNLFFLFYLNCQV
jgi:hypothetical protein